MNEVGQRLTVAVAVIVAWGSFSATLRAQAAVANDTVTASAQPARPPTPPKWQLSIRIGGDRLNQPTSGAATLPPQGIPENVAMDVSSRQVPSWFFGDGAALLNAVLTERHVSTPFVPIDSAVTTAGISRSNGPAFGLTLSRAVSQRYRVEVSLDGAQIAPIFTAAALGALETSRASFVSTWQSILKPAAFSQQSVSATNAVEEGSRLEWLVTGAVDITLRSKPHSTWYATLGGGLAADTGRGPTATLSGQYAFQFPFGPTLVPYAQSDTVTIVSARSRRPVGLLGGGWTHDLTKRLGVQADLRVGLGSNGVKTMVSATPKETLAFTPIDFILLLSLNPSVVLVSNQRFLNSTLSGPPLASFTTFSGGGLQVQTQLTAGFFLRF